MGLGIGATIGTGLYVQTGVVAKGFAGPSLVLSFLLAAIGCGFAALCYSELASMVPVAGSAYTYAYATLGELLAWIIGWDLILEYAIGSSFVAAGWSNYLDSFLRDVFHIAIDPRLKSAPWDFNIEDKVFLLKKVTLADGQIVQAWFDLPAILITAAVTVVLVIGIRESAGFNTAMVLLNIVVILTVVGIGATYVDPKNWRPFLHEKEQWHGVAEGAGRIFFAYIGFDSISTNAEEARNPQRDLAIGIMGALAVCTILYVAVAAVLTGMIPYREIDIQAPLAAALHAKGLTFAGGLITLGILAGMTSSLLVGNLSQPRILLAMARDGLLPHGFFAAVHPRFKTPWKSTILVGVVVATAAALAPLGFLADLVSIGTLFAFVVVSAAVWILQDHRSRHAPPLSRADGPRRLHPGNPGQRRHDVLPRPRELAATASSGWCWGSSSTSVTPAVIRALRAATRSRWPSDPENAACREVVPCLRSDQGPRWYHGLSRRSVDHPGGGLGRLGLRRLRGSALHDLQDADADRADRRRPGGDRLAGEYRVRGLPAGRGGRGPVLRHARRPLRPGPDHVGDDPGVLGVLRADGLRPFVVASPSAAVPGRGGYRRRMGGRRGAGGRDVPAPRPGPRPRDCSTPRASSAWRWPR